MIHRNYTGTTLPAIIFLTGMIGACGKYPCKNPEIDLGFRSFDSADLTVVIIDRYVKGSDFRELHDHEQTALRIYHTTDGITYSGGGRIDDAYDLQIAFPVINKVYRVSNISYEGESQKTGIGGVKETCSNSVTYSVNGNPFSVRGSSRDGDYPGDATLVVVK